MSDQPEFELPGAANVSSATLDKASTIADLLPKFTTLEVVSAFLKQRDVPHSAGSWKEMKEKRLVPAVQSRKVSLQDLRDLLSEAEEYDRAHVFLYRYSGKDLKSLMNPAKVRQNAKAAGVLEALDEVVVANRPKSATITQIRHEDNPHPKLVLKAVETRVEQIYVGEEAEGEFFVKKWKREESRAVNVARLHSDGLLEMSIYSCRNATDYAQLLAKFWEMLERFLPANSFADYSLADVKKCFWEKRAELEDRVNVVDSKSKNLAGTTLVASAGAQLGLAKDVRGSASVDNFLEGGGYTDAANLSFLPRDGVIDRKIRVLLPSRNNEFALTASVTRGEYEYVLNELRTHNK